MVKDFSLLRNGMSSSAKAESEKIYQAALASLPLVELRHAPKLTDEQLAAFEPVRIATEHADSPFEYAHA